MSRSLTKVSASTSNTMNIVKLNEEFKNLKLPPRQQVKPSRPASETTVTTNCFKMDYPKGMTVYKYRVDIKKFRGEKEFDLTKGVRSDVAVQHRKRACRSIFEDSVKKAEKEGKPWTDDKYSYVYDCGNLVYSSKPFQCFAEGEPSVGLRLIPSEDINSDFSRRYVGFRTEYVLVTIEMVLEFKLSLDEVDCHRETQQLLEILSSAQLMRNGDHFVFNNKFYGKTSRNDLGIGEAKCIKPGFEKNSRIGQRDGQAMAMLQLDAKKSPFFVGENLISVCSQLLNVRGERELQDLDNQSIRRVIPQLKGLIVRTLHTPKDKTRYFYVASLTKEHVKDISFEVDGETTTMVNFYKQKYNYTIRNTRVPCAVEKGAKTMCLYPLEVLEVERGQRVTCQKTGRNLAEQMIKECRMNPGELKEYIQESLAECAVGNDNKYLQNFQVKVQTRMEYTPGRVLFPPAIKYGMEQSVEPTRDGTLNWKLTRQLFFKPATIDNMVFIIFDDCVDDRNAGSFLEKILKAGREHGMRVPEERSVEMLYMRSEDTGRLEKLFGKMAKLTHPYIWCVTKQKLDPVHDVMKLLEAKHVVVTQHVSQQVLFKAIGNQGAFLVINNLVMKMNPKAGGVNHMVGAAKVFSDVNRNDSNATSRLFPKGRMFFGFDVSHAGPQSFADRALGLKQSEPSVVGMSYSLESATEVRGTYWMQEPRFAGISAIGRRVAKALQHRRKVTGQLPQDIVVFRGGVSEGEYDKVIVEMEQLKEAFGQVGQPGYKPSLTCVVVMTNSNFRLVPERIDTRAKPMDQNVRPGTVVDEEVTCPFYNEFLLVSQKGIMGTVRPSRCVIVATEQGETGRVLSLDDTQLLTYWLAHGHQIVTGSTALPLPLTAATCLSKRGRNNWKEVNFRDDDVRSALSGGSGGDCGLFRHDGTDDFFTKMSSAVESKLKTHYWA